MSSLHFRGSDRFGDLRNGVSFVVILTLTVASAMTGAAVVLVVQRYAQRHQMIEMLPAPTPIRHFQEHTTATNGQSQVARDTPNLSSRVSPRQPVTPELRRRWDRSLRISPWRGSPSSSGSSWRMT